VLTKSFLLNFDENVNKTFCVTDIETTGQKPEDSEIIEIATVKIQNGEIKEKFCSYVKPNKSIPSFITQMTGITDSDVKNAQNVREVLNDWLEFINGADYFCAHNVMFDYDFIYKYVLLHKLPIEILQQLRFFCTVKTARILYPDLKSRKLGDLIKHFKIPVNKRHRAMDDAIATASLLIMFLKDIAKKRNELINHIEKTQNEKLKSFEAAEYLSVPKEKIYEMVKSGALNVSEIYTTKSGDEGYLFLRSELENMLLE